MPRSRRDFTAENRFHIINHGVDSQDLFSIEDDWLLFESLLGRVCDDYGFRLNAFALMSNHYHLLADLSECNDRPFVSKAFGVLQSTYSKYFNKRTKRRGPLFEPRFLSFGVDGDAKTHRSIRYIHRNPIDICGPRALGNYRWSSLPVLLGRRASPHWLDCSLFMPQDPTAHLAELADCRKEDLWPLDALVPQRSTTIEALLDATERVVGRSGTDLTKRSIVCMLALDLRVADVVAISKQLVRSETQVRRSAARARSRRRDEPAFDHLIQQVLAELLPH